MNNTNDINKNVMNDTLLLCDKLNYLKLAIKNSIRREYVVYQENRIETNSIRNENMKIIVSKKKTFEAAEKYKGKNICCLDFANNHTIGGAPWIAGAQEETMCRASTLYPCLLAKKDEFYEKHKRDFILKKIDNMGNDDLIYIPDVVVFKTNDAYPTLREEDDWFKTDVIVSAAPQLYSHYDKNEYRKIMESRIKRILDVAAKENVQVFILGAFGCGAFRNPPEIIADIFASLLKNYNFEIVEFAVYCRRESDTENFDIFNSKFMDKSSLTNNTNINTNTNNTNNTNNNNNNKIEIRYFPIIEEKIKKIKDSKEKVNMIIVKGQGSDNKNLINTTFYHNLASIGTRKPISAEISEITKEDFPINIVDIAGPGKANYERIFKVLEPYIQAKCEKKFKNHGPFDIAWLCISDVILEHEYADLYLKIENDLKQILEKYKIPVIIVMETTVCYREDREISFVKSICPNARGYITVLHINEEMSKYYSLKNVESKNLDILVKETINILCETKRNAFVASQKVLIELKKEVAIEIVQNYLEKIKKLNDSSAVTSMVIEMIIEIADSFGLDLNNKIITDMVIPIFDCIDCSNISKSVKLVGNICINALFNEFTKNKSEYPSEYEIIEAIIKEKEKEKEK